MDEDKSQEPGAETESGSEPGAAATEWAGGAGAPPPLPGHGGQEAKLAEPSAFSGLDPRVVNLWRLQAGIGTVMLLTVTLIVAVIVAWQYRPALEWLMAGWVGLAVARTFYIFWYPPRAFRAWGYRIDARVLETRQGIWFRVLTLLPLSRLQHVDLNRGPFERMFGLASLTLYTAGTHYSTIDIPGLDATEAARLRDQLVALGGNDGL